jgi:Fe-S cluster assembly ATP-binding protein
VGLLLVDLLSIEHITITVGQKTVLSDFSLTIAPGTLHILRGPNGVGKSSLACALMGHPQYKITQGSIVFDGHNIAHMTPDLRARQGIFFAFQQPCALAGVPIGTFLSEAYREVARDRATYRSSADMRTLIESVLEKVGLPKNYIDRSVHENFSGGEKKRLELAQLLLFKPRLAILDEIDAGLDTQGRELVISTLYELKQENQLMSFLIITHASELVAALAPVIVHEMRLDRSVTYPKTNELT